MKPMTLVGMAFGTICWLGCSGVESEPRLPTVKVNGKLYMDDKPLGDCSLTLNPNSADPGDKKTPRPRAATAKVAADGSFELTTYDPGDGAAPGKYTVLIGNSGKAEDMMKPVPVVKPYTVDIQKPADGKPVVLELKLEGTGEVAAGPGMMPGMPGGGAPGRPGP